MTQIGCPWELWLHCVSVRVRFLHRRSRQRLFLSSISVFGCDRATDLRKYGTLLASRSARLARVRARARITCARSQVAWSRRWTSLVVDLNGTSFFLTLTHTRLEAATSSRRRCFAYPVATLCIFPVFDSGSEFPSPAGFCEMCTPLSGPVCDGTRITPSFAIAFTLRSRVDHTFLLRTRVIWVCVFVYASTLLEPVYSMQVHVQSCSLPRFYKHVLRPCTHSAAFFFSFLLLFLLFL